MLNVNIMPKTSISIKCNEQKVPGSKLYDVFILKRVHNLGILADLNRY